MTEQEKQQKIDNRKAEQARKKLIAEAAKDLIKGKMSPEVYDIFKKKNN